MMAPTTPATKRHHLPFISDNRPKMSSGNNQLNNIFYSVCVLALVLQLFCTVSTWHDHHQATRIALAQPNSNNSFNGATTSAIAALHPIRSGETARRRVQHLQTPTSSSSVAGASAKMILSSSSSRNNNSNDKLRYGAPAHSGRLRVLVGILTADFFNDQIYRKRHRSLFKLWNDKRVCSLPDFKAKPLAERYVCELIYVFVLGANPDATPELVDGSRPMEVLRPIKGHSKDMNEPDMILLNIRENMNEGKSQTWMHYGAQIAAEYDLDYVAKCDADSIFHLHDFFRFAYKHMPPAPYNSMMYIGALRDKAYWPKHDTEEERIRFESFFGNNYEGVHFYVAGQIYIVSTDLAAFIGKEALENKCSYCEGHEDHDISAMAFHSPEPVKLVVIGRSHRFWEHPVKGEPRWKRILARETARMAGKPFEGKLFSTESSLQSVVQQARSLFNS
jgi:Galactosyltransferase